MTRSAVINWLLEDEQPAIRYLTLTQLLGRPERDPEVRAAKQRIPKTGWVEEILARRDPAGWWVRGTNFYQPKYVSTNWNMLALSDLGATRAIPAVRASAELWMGRAPLLGGGVGGFSGGKGHLCFTGNMARALVKLGYADDPRVGKAMDWIARTASPKGGWTCWSFDDGPAKGRNLDSWEGLSALAVYPRSRWTPAMRVAAEKGAEFFLERELHRQGDRYNPWYRFHWPTHYYYDVLVGLDILTALGHGDDPRLGFALRLLRKKRRPDGRWNMDAIHPDVSGKVAQWFKDHPKALFSPLAFEEARKPSKMITLRALTVLARIGEEPAG
jgi:hypothetical protein